MAYKVVVDFKDLKDSGYQYKAGDTYPHAGAADAERVKTLATPTTQRGPLIVEVADTPKRKKAEKEEG